MENHGKSPFLIDKPSINGPFSMAMLNNQRVYIPYNHGNNPCVDAPMSIQNLQLSGASDGAGFGRAVSRTAELRLLVNQHIQWRLGAGDNDGRHEKKGETPSQNCLLMAH